MSPNLCWRCVVDLLGDFYFIAEQQNSKLHSARFQFYYKGSIFVRTGRVAQRCLGGETLQGAKRAATIVDLLKMSIFIPQHHYKTRSAAAEGLPREAEPADPPCFRCRSAALLRPRKTRLCSKTVEMAATAAPDCTLRQIIAALIPVQRFIAMQVRQ